MQENFKSSWSSIIPGIGAQIFNQWMKTSTKPFKVDNEEGGGHVKFIKTKWYVSTYFQSYFDLKFKIGQTLLFRIYRPPKKCKLSNKKDNLKGSVREKWKGVYAYVEKYSMVIATNFTSICRVYEEKIVIQDKYQRT